MPSDVVRIDVYSPSTQRTNRTITAPTDIEQILGFVAARTNGWRRTSDYPEMGLIEAFIVFPRVPKGQREHFLTFGASYNRFNCGWSLVRSAKQEEIKQFFSLVGEDYTKYFRRWQ